MSQSSQNSTVDIIPSPRVLRMLGMINFKPWQCLAELVDNAIDAFSGPESGMYLGADQHIQILLPTQVEVRNGEGKIEVKDNGVGMTQDQLAASVRAGYSGNDPVEKMGLFGMGFNIGTARLGVRTEVWTTTSDSVNWIGVEVDFDELERNSRDTNDRSTLFRAPLRIREKSPQDLEARTHGTVIIISKLKQDIVNPLLIGASRRRNRDQLGKIYGKVMEERGIRIFYAQDEIKPWKHCIWGDHRSVEHRVFGTIPAVIPIDELLDDRRYCTTCWVWLMPSDFDCPSCGLDTMLVTRQRRVKGWIGVQRYFDQQHYGIDLIRNGRVIEEGNKDFFYWHNPTSDIPELEYPVDATHWGGRIVGALEIDFVRVSHQKDYFEKLDEEWAEVIAIVRGNAPLRPDIAERNQMERNKSPLARLFAGFRGARPTGLKTLVPGASDGGGINEELREMVQRFDQGDPEYQDDSKWYALVEQAEAGNRGEGGGGRGRGGALPGDKPPVGDPAAVVRHLELTADSDLSKEYVINFLPGSPTLYVNARRLASGSLEAPFTVNYPGRYVVNFDYDPQHEFFQNSLDTPVDFLITEVANYALAVSGESATKWPVSIIAKRLKDASFPDRTTDVTILGESATSLLHSLRIHYDDALRKAIPIAWEDLPQSTFDQVKNRILNGSVLGVDDVQTEIKSGAFVQYIDNQNLVAVFRVWPKLAMDGTFFVNAYEDLHASGKQNNLNTVHGALSDVVWLSDEARSATQRGLDWRLRYTKALASLRLLESWMVTT